MKIAIRYYAQTGNTGKPAEALNSNLFRALRENGYLLEDHADGCVFYEKCDLVETLPAESK